MVDGDEVLESDAALRNGTVRPSAFVPLVPLRPAHAVTCDQGR